MNKLLIKVFDYLKSVASPVNSAAEAKLFIALTSFLLVGFITLIDLFTAYIISDYMYYTLTTLIVSCLGLDSYENSKAMNVKKRVASDVISEKPDKEVIEEAKDIMQSEKP